ncbi:5-azacytidine-induced protein 1 [Pteropus alecto]|uniref:5-azacytidine-induced protein 1 n=1 Tax=Pteropus alecto TaxID=9402 RepID=L5KN76_PTEAL|nr:5-azacytidine-induced protein 1 [Pteropus alecto]
MVAPGKGGGVFPRDRVPSQCSSFTPHPRLPNHSQLIEDKKTLGEKCQAVLAELKQGDQRHKEREAEMQDQHRLEIKKLKELMSATEKVRREKWINEKTRRIKEVTVRGLEPEIQKLIAKHKQEVKRLRTLHAAELQQAEERAAQRYGRQAEALREQLQREKEALGQQERERAQQRIHRLEADMTLAREESERAAESRVKRIRDKYEVELSELEQSERKLQGRCTELKGRLAEADGERVRLQGLLRHKDKELADVQALERLTREKQAELEQVHGRVKTALAKKEEAVSSLRRQHEAAMKRADHLEELLEQRRRPFPSTK